MQTNRINSLNGNGTPAVDPVSDRNISSLPASDRGEGQGEGRSHRDNSGATAASTARFKIPGDVISKTCENLPDDQRHALKWAAGFCRERNLSCEEFGALLTKPGSKEKDTYHGDSVYAALTGRREAGSLDRFCAAVHKLRRSVEETNAREGRPFVETSLSKRIFEACANARRKNRVGFVLGETQIGKSRAAAEYARRHNHGETHLVRMPTGGALKHFLTEFAVRLGIGVGNKSGDLRRRIIDSFDERMLLIVDEGEQSLESPYGLAAIDFVREIHDRRKCGLVILAALNFRNALKTSYTLKKLWLRGLPPVVLPSRPPVSDLHKFADSFGLPPADDKTIGVKFLRTDIDGEEVETKIAGNPLSLQTAVIKDYGLGRWLAILEEAADLATSGSAQLKWNHVLAAHAKFQAMEDAL